MTILKNRFIVLMFHPTGMDFVKLWCYPKIPKSIELVNRLIFLFPLTQPPPIRMEIKTVGKR
jgi:hypothetical protein